MPFNFISIKTERKNILYLFLSATIMIVLLAITNSNGQWSTARLSLPRYNLAAASVGSKVFFGGGVYANVYRSNVDIFDSNTNSWTTANLSEARYGLTATSVGTKVFFAGGFNGTALSNVVNIYNNSTNTWSTHTLSQARYNLRSASIGTKVFFAGGSNSTGNSNVVDIYDNATNTWTTATLSIGRSDLSVTSVDTKVFFAGGMTSSGYSNTIDIYDNSNNTWSTATLTSARSGSTAVSVGTKVFFAGGRTASSYSNAIDIYDNSSNTWTTATLSQARAMAVAASVGNKIFIAGGNNGSTDSNTVDIYDNSSNTWTTSTLSQARSGLSSTSVGIKAFFGGGATSFDLVDIYDITPLVSSLSLSSGSIGTQVVITGANFNTVPSNNIVKFNGTAATVIASSATSITTSVPSGAKSGTVSVTVDNLTGTSPTSFIVAPTISSFTPVGGAIGTTVTISGTNFSTSNSNNVVKFNGTSATVTTSSLTSITTTVPSNATSGTLSVTFSGLTGTSSTNFIVTPSISGFSPTSGPVDTQVIITGQNFSATPSNNIVKFNGSNATVISSTATSITAKVPTNASTGLITVAVDGFTGSSAANFTLQPSITSFSPSGAAVGESVVITGTGFSSTATSNIVKFNGISTAVSNSTINTITATVPSGSTNGKITVTVNGLTGTSTDDLIIRSSQPLGPPTSLIFNSVTSSGMSASFTAAINNPTGYIVLRKEGSSPTDVPSDGIQYVSGNDIGTSKVISVGDIVSFSNVYLSPGVIYYYAIFSYNGSGTATNYLTSNPLVGNRITLAAEPTTQATNINFSSITTSSMNVSFSAATGNPSGYIVLKKEGASVSELAFTDGTTYNVGDPYGQSDIVYVGPLTTFSATDLSPNTVYYFDIFTYNGSTESINYFSTAALEGSQTTLALEPINQPTSFLVNNTTSTSMICSFTASSNPVSGYLILRKAVQASSIVPVDGVIYGETVDVVQSGPETTFNNTGLIAGTTYYFTVYAYNGNSSSINYLTTSPLIFSAITLPPKPLALDAINILTNSFKPKWTESLSAVSYELDVSNTISFDQFIAGYSSKMITDLDETVIGLLPNQTYYYRVRARNASGVSESSNIISITTSKDVISQAATGTATDINAIAAKLNGTFNPNNVSTSVFFEWGTTSELGNKTTEQTITGSGNKNASAVLTELQDNTTYYFRITGTSTAGVISGNIATFTTSKVTAFTGVASNATLNSITLDGTINTSGATAKVYFEWGTTTSLGNKTINQTITTSGDQTISANLSDLSGGTTYFFRLVAISPGGIAIGTSGTFTTLSPTQALSFAGTPSSIKQGNDVKLSALLQNGAGAKTVKLSYRGITAPAFKDTLITSSSNTFEVTLPYAKLDKLGLEYFFTASDATITNKVSDTSYIYTTVAQPIPNLSAGGQPENYRIISIPVAMSTTPRTVFDDLFTKYGEYNDEKWKVMHYEPGDPKGKNIDFGSISTIVPGQGYWFNYIEKSEVKVSGTAVTSNQSAPFILNLKKGWNQIGNPYTFNISWSDILMQNPDVKETGTKFYEYDGSKVSFKQNDIITAWSGGFVKATAACTLKIPVTVKQTTGGRQSANANEIEYHQLDQLEWFLPIHILQGNAYNDIGGIGMHPDASVSNDRYDEQSLPRFQNYLELNSYHPEFFLQRFTRDIVPTVASYIWDYSIESNFGKSQATLTWDAQSLGSNDAQLKLYDEEAGELIDMKRVSAYSFTLSDTRKIKIFYSADEKSLAPDISGMGKPYPNPFSQQVIIPFFIGSNSPHVQIIIYDLTGGKVKELINQKQTSGFYQLQWDGHDEQGNRVANGVYLYRFTSSDSKTLSGRLVVK